jgi:hypothetical protein
MNAVRCCEARAFKVRRDRPRQVVGVGQPLFELGEATVWEPEGDAVTAAAIERLGARFAGLPGQVRHALGRTRDHAGNLSNHP